MEDFGKLIISLRDDPSVTKNDLLDLLTPLFRGLVELANRREKKEDEKISIIQPSEKISIIQPENIEGLPKPREKALFGIKLIFVSSTKKDDINRLCPQFATTLETLLNSSNKNKFVVAEDLPTCILLAKIVLDFSSTMSSFSDNIQSVVDSLVGSVPNLGIILLRNADETHSTASEIQSFLPFKNTSLNGRPFAYKLLMRNKVLNTDGIISKKKISELCNSLNEAASMMIGPSSFTAYAGGSESSSSVLLFFASESNRKDIERVFPSLKPKLSSILGVEIIESDKYKSSLPKIICTLSSSKASFSDSLQQAYSKLQSPVVVLFLRQASSNMEESMKVRLTGIVKPEPFYYSQLQFHLDKFVEYEYHNEMVKNLKEYVQKMINNVIDVPVTPQGISVPISRSRTTDYKREDREQQVELQREQPKLNQITGNQRETTTVAIKRSRTTNNDNNLENNNENKQREKHREQQNNQSIGEIRKGWDNGVRFTFCLINPPYDPPYYVSGDWDNWKEGTILKKTEDNTYMTEKYVNPPYGILEFKFWCYYRGSKEYFPSSLYPVNNDTTNNQVDLSKSNY